MDKSVTRERENYNFNNPGSAAGGSRYSRREFLKISGGASLVLAVGVAPSRVAFAAQTSTGSGNVIDYTTYTITTTSFPVDCPAPADESISEAIAKLSALNAACKPKPLSYPITYMDSVDTYASILLPVAVNAWQGTPPTDAQIEFVSEPGYPKDTDGDFINDRFKYHVRIKAAGGPFVWNVYDPS
jgi:hypothetical protein